MNLSRRVKMALLAATAAGGWMAYTRHVRRKQREQYLRAGVQDGFSHQSVTTNGIRLHCVSHGAGRTVLFLHGFPEAWFAWETLLRAFGAAGYQAVAPDLRGYNLSEKPSRVEDYRLDLLVEDVKGLLDALSPHEKAVLVGHDWGGIVAWAIAAAYPEYLHRLVILNAPHPNIFARELATNLGQMAASAYFPLFRQRWAERAMMLFDYALLRGIVFGTTTRSQAFSPGLRARYHQAWAQPGALTGGLNYYRALTTAPLPGKRKSGILPRLQSALALFHLSDLPPMKIDVPTLVLWGEKDPALKTGNLDGLEQYVPRLTVARLPEASHWLVHEEPERIIALIRAFLEDGDSR